MQLQGNVRRVVDETAVSVFEYSSSRVHAVGRSLAAGAEWVGDSTRVVCALGQLAWRDPQERAAVTSSGREN